MIDKLNIDKHTFAIDDNNRYKVNSVKTQIIIAISLRKKNYHITRLQHKEMGKSKRWNTFTICRNGDILQHYDDVYHSDFLDIKNVDKQSISIVLENMGCLFYVNNNKYVNWLNEECELNRVGLKKWKGYDYWEIFNDIQIESLAKLCVMLCEKHNIPKEVIGFQHHHKEIHKFKGILFKSNFIDECGDTNPLFNQTKLIKLIE